MTFYYYDNDGNIKMKSETKIDCFLNEIELPEQDLSGTMAKIVHNEIVKERLPHLILEEGKIALEKEKARLKQKAQAGTLTMADVNEFIRVLF